MAATAVAAAEVVAEPDVAYLPPVIRSAMDTAFIENLKQFFVRYPKPAGPTKTEMGKKLSEMLNYVKEHVDLTDPQKKEAAATWIRICKADLGATYGAIRRLLIQEGAAEKSQEAVDNAASTETEAPKKAPTPPRASEESSSSEDEEAAEEKPQPAAAAAAKTGILASVASLFRTAKPKEPVLSPLQMLIAAGPTPAARRVEPVAVDSDDEQQQPPPAQASPLQMLLGAGKPVPTVTQWRANSNSISNSKKRPATYDSDDDDRASEREELSTILGIPSAPPRQRPRLAAAV